MEQSKTFPLVILGIIALIAVIGLVLMFKMSATGGAVGGITTWGRAIAKSSEKAYNPYTATWGKAIAGVEAFKVGSILGQRCLVVDKSQAERGAIPIESFNDLTRGVCYPYFTGFEQNTDSVCCIESYIQQMVPRYNII
ncbi:MAG: hypothetical protein QW666_02685 [Candidatus Woesearchaeota archaeon]